MPHGQPDEDVYQPRVQPEDLPRKIVPHMDVVPVAQAFGEAADATSRKYHADSATWASDQIAQARINAVQSLDSAKANAPEGDQTGFTQKFLAGFDKSNGDLINSAGSNPVARGMIEKGMTDLRQSLQTQTMAWEAKQNVAYRHDSFQKNLTVQLPIVEAHPELADQVGSTLADQVRVMGIEPSTQYELFRAMHEQLSLAAANGLARQNPNGVLNALNSPERAGAAFEPVLQLNDQQREAVRAKANEGLAKPVYSSLTDGDTITAQAKLDSVRDILDPQTAFGLQRTIDAQVKEKQNEQKQDIADRLQDSMTAAANGLNNPLTVTRAELNVLFPKDAQRHWDGLQSVMAAGAMAKQYDQMTPEQIHADLDKNKPTEGGPEATFQIAGYKTRFQAAQQSLAARNADPVQFAIDSGAGWKPLDFKQPDALLSQLRSRANSRGFISEQTGTSMPLLSIGETKQFTDGLDNQQPSDRLQTLTILRKTMPDDASYAALMRQIAPGSPLTAIAGTTLDQPQTGATPTWYDPRYAISPIVGQRILEGEQILRARDEKGINSKFPMPKDTEMMPQFIAAIGGSNSDLFRGRPNTLDSYFAAFKAAYAAEANHAGVSNGVISQNLANRAAEDVIGRTTEYGATTLVVPPGMDPTRFEGIVNTASSAALKSAGYSDSDVAALRGHGLRELGDTLGTGRYVIINGSGDALKSKDGKKTVILDLNQQMRIPSAIPAGSSSFYDPDVFTATENRAANWGK